MTSSPQAVGGAKGRHPDVLWADGSDPDSLIDFAVRSRLLLEYRTYTKAAAALDRDRDDGAGKRLSQRLDALDLGLIRRIEDLLEGTGRTRAIPLTTFAESLHLQSHCLRGLRGRPGRFWIRHWIEAHVEGHRWAGASDDVASRRFRDLLTAGPARNIQESLVRGHAMVAWLDRIESDADLDRQLHPASSPAVSWKGERTYRQCVGEVVDDLLDVVGQSLPQGASEARMLVARAFRFADERVWNHVAHSPLGFRAVRVVTETLRLLSAEAWADQRTRRDIERQCRHLLKQTHDVNPSSLYRARSFWEEAAAAAPHGSDWTFVDAALSERACSGQLGDSPDLLPVRERMYAAQVAFQRLSGHPIGRLDKPPAAEAVRFVERFASSVAGIGESGLDYAAAYLRSIVAGGEPVFLHSRMIEAFTSERKSTRAWQELSDIARTYRMHDRFFRERDEARLVVGVLDSGLTRDVLVDLLPSVIPGLKTLIGQACVTIDGLWRRNALETIIAAGLRDQAVEIVRAILERVDANHPVAGGGTRLHHTDSMWLREHAVFCLGFLGGAQILPLMVDQLFVDGMESVTRPGYRDTRMTALMAIGDHAETAAATEVEKLSRVLVQAERDSSHVAERRAATYALAMLRPRDYRSRSHLESLRSPPSEAATAPPDRIVTALAEWALDRIDAHEMIGAHCPTCGGNPNDLRVMASPLAAAHHHDPDGPQ